MTSALVKQLLSLSIACGKHSSFNVLFMCRCTIAYITLYVKYNVFHTSDIWMPLAPPLISKGEAVCRSRPAEPASTDTPLHL